MGNRREFLKVSLAASAGIAICGCSGNGSTAKIFNDSERNCLIAISEQIVPADEQWGGATEAGVINYIENWVGKYQKCCLLIKRAYRLSKTPRKGSTLKTFRSSNLMFKPIF